MRVLYIDTSSSYLYSSLVEDGHVLSEIKKDYGQSLSEVALPGIVSLFQEAGWNPKEIDKIIVVNGPGSFTGIRIGLTIAKVYAWSLNIPITTIYSLEAMAVSSKQDKIHVPMINARRGYVFAAIYDKDYQEILKPQHITIEDLKNHLKELSDYEVITNDELEEFEERNSYDPDMAKIVEHFQEKKEINPHAVNPEYLKLTEAEESKL